MSNFSNVSDYSVAILAAFDSRKSYEIAKAESTESDCSSMLKTLADMRKTVSHSVISEIMFASAIDAEFINKSERSNARFNVYSAEKVINVARSLAKVSALNHYTRAILATMQKLALTEQLLTHDDAQSACSLDCKSKDAKREKLIVKYQKHVAKSTAATQSSSSINALQVFGVITETRDAANVTSYRLNVESENCKTLLAAL